MSTVDSRRPAGCKGVFQLLAGMRGEHQPSPPAQCRQGREGGGSPEHPKPCPSWALAPELPDPQTAAVQPRGRASALGVRQTGGAGTTLRCCTVFLHSVLSWRCAVPGLPGIALPAKRVRACLCASGPGAVCPALVTGLELVLLVLGAGVAGFDRWRRKSPSCGPALRGGPRTQLAAVALWEHPSGRRRSGQPPWPSGAQGWEPSGRRLRRNGLSRASGDAAAFLGCHSPAEPAAVSRPWFLGWQ